MKLGDILKPVLPPLSVSTGEVLAWWKDPAARNRLILGGAGFIFFVYAYFIAHTCLLGTTGSPATSMFGWLWAFWKLGADYAHGYVVPFVSIGLGVWLWKRRLRAEPLVIDGRGFAVVVTAVTLYWIGAKATNPRILAISMVLLVAGTIWYLAGAKWARALWFPCAFLLFMIPLNFLDEVVAFPLRMFVTTFSVSILNLFGMDVAQRGTAIYSLHQRFEPLDVADPCSGIRSLVALMALTALYGYITMDRGWKKWLLFVSSIPLAVLGNLARITTIAFVAQGFGQDLATTIYHDYSGYIVFSLAILCMLALGTTLNIHYRELIYRWTQEEVPIPRPPSRSAK